MATLSAQSLSSPELGPKCANLHLVLISANSRIFVLTPGVLKMLQIPAANSKTWWPDTVNFEGLGAQTLEIQQRLQILGFGGLFAMKVLQMPGFGGLLALKVLQIPGFGGLLALKVLQIPGFRGLLALKVLQIPGFGGLLAKTGKTLHSNSPQTDFKARDSEGRILKPQILKARIPKTGTLASHTS